VLLIVCENDFGGNALTICYGLHKPSFTLLEDGTLQEHPPLPNEAILYNHRTGAARWLHYSALYRALWPRLSVLRSKLRGGEDRAAAGIMNHHYYCSREELERIDWELFTALVKRMTHCCATHGAKFLIYPHPDMAAVWEPCVQQAIKECGVQ